MLELRREKKTAFPCYLALPNAFSRCSWRIYIWGRQLSTDVSRAKTTLEWKGWSLLFGLLRSIFLCLFSYKSVLSRTAERNSSLHFWETTRCLPWVMIFSSGWTAFPPAYFTCSFPSFLFFYLFCFHNAFFLGIFLLVAENSVQDRE